MVDIGAAVEERAPADPGLLALWLLHACALDAAAQHAASLAVPDAAVLETESEWTLLNQVFDQLTTVLDGWDQRGVLAVESTLAATALAMAYTAQELRRHDGDHARLRAWLVEAGDQVAHAQNHTHPAGPTAIEILDTVADEATRNPPEAIDSATLKHLGTTLLAYLRPGHKVEDARTLLLTLAVWARLRPRPAHGMEHRSDRRIPLRRPHRDLTRPHLHPPAAQNQGPPRKSRGGPFVCPLTRRRTRRAHRPYCPAALPPAHRRRRLARTERPRRARPARCQGDRGLPRPPRSWRGCF
ncbi:hypothetical protein [Kitasatospora griseola]|uniref:hypothetical protein n=1 Tax=Kitasatospora griseola TaxID=2064 RepID=UPI00166FA972|nr:hypothetical protein [Kitasatospora griseola]